MKTCNYKKYNSHQYFRKFDPCCLTAVKLELLGGRDSQSQSGLDYWLILAYLDICDLSGINEWQPASLNLALRRRKEIYIYSHRWCGWWGVQDRARESERERKIFILYIYPTLQSMPIFFTEWMVFLINFPDFQFLFINTYFFSPQRYF